MVNDSTSDSALTLLNAGRDLQLKTEAIGQEHTAEWGKNNWRRDSQSTEIGSTVKAAGNVQLQAGQDIGMRAADIASDNAAITAIAGRDLKIEAGESSQGYAEAHQVKSGGFLSKKTITTFNSQDNTQAEGSTLSAEKINLQAGRDVSVNARDVVATQDVNISAGRDVGISAGHDTQTEAHERQVKKSGLFGSGMGFTIGSQKTSTAMRTTQETAAASTIGSVEGNVNIQAGRDYSQVGSDVLSPKGDISIGAQNIAITEVREASRSEQETKFKQSGLSVSVSAPVISALQTAVQMKQAAGKTDDTRMQALAAGAAGLNAFTSGAVGSAANLANATNATDAAKAANVSVSITVGSSKSQNNVTQTTDQAAGSKVQAGGDVTLVATGDAANPGHANSGNILVQGSDISAGQNATLAASNQIDLQSAQQLAEQHSSNKSSSAAVGVAISYGTNGLAGGITANASAARGKADGNDVVHSNSHIEAGNTATLVSGGDTNIRGAQVQGKQVIADAGGDLNIQSQQDTSVYKSKQTSVGGGITVGAGVAGSASYANSTVKGDNVSVTEQSGIQAGDKGFQIDVAGNTDLQGAVIASHQTAIDNNANSLRTGTLTASDIENHSDYKASGASLSGGYAVGGGDKGKSDSPSADAGSNSGGATSGNGANWSWQNFNGQTGVTGAGAGYSQESGSDSSTTRSGISAGTVTVTDEAGQQKKAGKTADEVLANVNRNVLSGDNANSLSKNWDAEKLREQVQAQAKIVATFGETASKALGDYAGAQRLKLQAEAQQESDPQRQAELQAEADKWAEGGAYRIAAHAIIGALGGRVEGAAGAATSAAVAQQLTELTQDLPEGIKQAVGTGVAAGLGALTGGGSGAAAAFNQDANNRQLHPDEVKWLKDKAKGFAEKEGISEEDALKRLTQQALKQVDLLWRAQLTDGDDASAKAFLGEQQQTFTNDVGNQQKLFTTQGQQILRPEMFANISDTSFYKEFAQTGISRNLNDGLVKELKDQGLGIKDGVVDLYNAAKEDPKSTAIAVLKASWSTVVGLPGTIKDGVHESANAIGEGIETAFDDNLSQKLNEVYGTDVQGKQRAILGIRSAVAIAEATGVGKVGKELGKEVLEAASKKLDDVLDERALEAFVKTGGKFNTDGTPVLNLKQLTNDQKRVMGELFGEQGFVKQALPDGQKLARMQGAGTNGLDDLYKVNRPDVDYVVVEYKFVGNPKDKGSWKLDETNDGKQGSERWFLGGNRLENAVENEMIADAIRDAAKLGRVETLVVTTRPDGSTLAEVLDAFGKTKSIDASKILNPKNNMSGVQP